MRAPASARPGRPSWLAPAAVMAAALLAFWPALQNGFVDWDDTWFIAKNPNCQGLDAARLRWMFTSLMGGIYHPLTWLSYALNFRVLGPSPAGFHAVNLALHAINAGLFYHIGRRLLASAASGSEPSRAPSGGDLATGAAVSALFFAVHPLRVESVAWAMGRKDVLSGTFGLISVLYYLRAQESSAGRPRLWSITAFALALLSKPTVVALPLALMVLDVYPLRRLSLRSCPPGVLAEKIPYLTLALAAGAANLAAQPAGHLELPAELGWAARAAHFCSGLAFYAWKTFLPVGLSPLYDLSAARQPWGRSALSSELAVAVAVLLLFFLRRRRPALAAAAAFYALMLLPTLGALDFRLPLADRYTYLPGLAWAVLAGGAVLAVLQSGIPGARVLAGVAAASWLLVLGLMTFRQTAVWRDGFTLWSYALKIDPGLAVGHHQLGNFLASRGRLEAAVDRYRQAVRLDASYALAHNSLGLALARGGRHEEAVAHYLKAAGLRANYWEAHNNAGLSYAHLGRATEALRHFEAAVAIAPERAEIHSNFGLALASLGRRDEALERLALGLRLNPDQPRVAAIYKRLAAGPARRPSL